MTTATILQDADAVTQTLTEVVRRAARLIADTLTVQVPGAAYLLLDGDEARYLPDERMAWVVAVCDENGKTLHAFPDYREPENPLPELPAGHPLRDTWGGSPDLAHYQYLISALVALGAAVDWVSYDALPEDSDLTEDDPVILLSPRARPESPDLPDWHSRCPILRPVWD